MSLFTPFNISSFLLRYSLRHTKKIKNVKSIVGIFSLRITYDGLIFSSYVFIIEEVKDEMLKHNGRYCFSIQ